MAMMHPIVSNNGTARAELVQQRLAAIRGVEGAMKALSDLKPNMRDYIGATDAYEADRAIYCDRFARLDVLRNELQDEALALHKGGK